MVKQSNNKTNIQIDDLYSESIERDLVGIMLIDEDKVSKILSMVNDRDFYQRELRIIISAIKQLSQANKPIDIVTVSELLKFNNELDLVGGRGFINDIALGVISTTNWEQLCKTVIKYSKKRSLIDMCRQAIDDLQSSKDVDDVASTLSTTSGDIMTRTSTTRLQGLSEGVIEMFDNVEHLINNSTKGTAVLGVSTGFTELDNCTSGLCPGRFYLLGARPSMGKSALAQQIAENVAKTKNVLFFSLEMGLEEYTQRSIYRLSGYNQEHLTRGIIPRDKILEAFAEASTQLTDLKLSVVDDAKCTLQTVEKNIQQCKSQFGSCDLVIIDYIQLMKGTDSRIIKDYDIVTDNSQGLKQLARKYKLPIIGLCQLNRTLEARADKRPILADLRDSGSLEQDADCVMFLHRQEVFEPQRPELRGFAELVIAKNRQGRRGVILPLAFNGNKVEFKEIQNDRGN